MAAITHTPSQIEDNYRLLISWAYAKVDFLGLPNLKEEQPLRLDDVYVPLSLTWAQDKSAERLYVPAVLEQARQVVVLGDPGSGKSTLIKVLAYQFGRIEPAPLARRLGPHVPIPIILRDYDVSEWKSWKDMLSAFVAQLPTNRPPEVSAEWLAGILREGRGILLLDGLDEVGSPAARKRLRDEIVFPMLPEMNNSLAVFTSRIVGYEEAAFDWRVLHRIEKEEAFPLSSLRRCYVAPFDHPEIKEFITRWYALREQDERLRESGVASLLDAISRNQQIRALASNPGLLTLMALVHRVTATLPSGRVKLYDKIAEAYLETIQIYRKLPQFDATLEQMKRWMARIGWEMQLRRSEKGSAALRTPRNAVLYWLSEAIRLDRPSNAEEIAEQFLNYIASRSGLLIPVSPSEFAFAHLSIQEYFASWHLRGLIRKFDDLVKRCVEHVKEPWWHETFVLLFSMLSEFPGAGDDLVEGIAAKTDRGNRFVAEFFAQLLAEEQNGLNTGNGFAAKIAVDFALNDDAVSSRILRTVSESRYRAFVRPALDENLKEGPEKQSDHFVIRWRIISDQYDAWPAPLEEYVSHWATASWRPAQIEDILGTGSPSAVLVGWLERHASLELWSGSAYRWLPLLLSREPTARVRTLAEVSAVDLCLQLVSLRRWSFSFGGVTLVSDTQLLAGRPSLARTVALAARGNETALEELRNTVNDQDDWASLLRASALLAAGRGTPGLCEQYQQLLKRLDDGKEFDFPPYLSAQSDLAGIKDVFGRWTPDPQDYDPESPNYARMTMPVSELLKSTPR